MPMTPAELERLVRAAFADAEVVIEDLAGDGDHYRLTITSERFRGKSRIEQHRMVYAALGPHMGGTLHALALVTRVPETAGEGSRS